MLDNEGNQKVQFHDLHEHDDEDHDHQHEEIEDKLHKWYGLLLDKLIID